MEETDQFGRGWIFYEASSESKPEFDVNFDSKFILTWPSLSSHILIFFFNEEQ